MFRYCQRICTSMSLEQASSGAMPRGVPRGMRTEIVDTVRRKLCPQFQCKSLRFQSRATALKSWKPAVKSMGQVYVLSAARHLRCGCERPDSISERFGQPPSMTIPNNRTAPNGLKRQGQGSGLVVERWKGSRDRKVVAAPAPISSFPHAKIVHLQQRLTNYVSCHLPRIFTLSYSYRNATIGSTFVARRAGR
jgi:hypothetical protein